MSEDGIITWVEQECERRPLCGSTDIEIWYVECPVDFVGYWSVGDRFRCNKCGAGGEYE